MKTTLVICNDLFNYWNKKFADFLKVVFCWIIPACAPNCDNCLANGAGKCDTCNSGFVLTSDKICAGI